jgi:hypothetical protein
MADTKQGSFKKAIAAVKDYAETGDPAYRKEALAWAKKGGATPHIKSLLARLG